MSFTAKFNRVVDSVLIDCAISPFIEAGKSDLSKTQSVKCLWDTGCGGNLISKSLVQKMGLIPFRKRGHFFKGLLIDKNSYLVYVHLPNGIALPVETMETDFLSEPFVIGMDIINKGNFSIENSTNKTVVRFEMSQEETMDESNIEKNLDPSKIFEIEEPQSVTEDPVENSIILEYAGKVNSLLFHCKASLPQNESKKINILAVWDTGAMMCMISKHLAEKLQVVKCGKRGFGSVNGPCILDICLVNLYLYDGSIITVLAGIQDEDERQDFIIGMSVIGMGNFTIECSEEETKMTFELLNPVMKFQAHTREISENPKLRESTDNKKLQRNDPCSCESGKKFKSCCGKSYFS